MKPTTVAIIGGGPAGAMAAETLARGWGLDAARSAAHRVLVFEEKDGWEKPCGGGLTLKALRRYPYLAEAANGGNLLHDAEFIASSGEVLRLHLRSPLAIYSRATLNRLLLRRAENAGAQVVPDRILRVRREAEAWEIEGRAGAYRADFIVLAAGARTRLRQTWAQDFLPRDLVLTFGYYLPITEDPLRVQFFENFEGYAWSFPRLDHLSVGIAGKVDEQPMRALRERLGQFMRDFGYTPDPKRIYAHVLPSLSRESWKNLKLAGRGWALVGDAAGLVDPLTGEGIYYAMRSGELLAEALLEGRPDLYPKRVRNDFGKVLALGARFARPFYHAEFLGKSISTRMIEAAARNRDILEVVQDLIEGTESYAGMIARLRPTVMKLLAEKTAGKLRSALPTGFSKLF